MNRIRTLLLAALLASGCTDGHESPAPGATPDDADRAGRLVTLAPHLTELVFAAGAGGQLVGVSAYSNYPPESLALDVVSDAFTVDLERLARLEPTLVLAWDSGTPRHVVDELRALGYRVETLRTQGLEDVALALERIGALTGRPGAAKRAAGDFRSAVATLRGRYAAKPPITVFYQVSSRPLYTVAGNHYIAEIVALCGGRNVFSDLDELAPAVTVEAVVARNPDVLLAGAADGDPFAEWDRWPDLAFNRYGNRFTLPPDEIGRATPRLVDAAAAVCSALDEGRRNRGDRNGS